jgi:hypothetical protein
LAVALGLLACLTIDFSNPLLPGVVRFDDSESVYAVRAERPRTEERSAATALFPARGWRPTDLEVTLLRAPVVAAEQPRPAPSLRPRGLQRSRTVPASGASEDH